MKGQIYYTRLQEENDNAHWVILRHPDGKLSNPNEPTQKFDACVASLTGVGIYAASRGEAQILADKAAKRLGLGFSYMDAYTLTHPVIIIDKKDDDD